MRRTEAEFDEDPSEVGTIVNYNSTEFSSLSDGLVQFSLATFIISTQHSDY